MKNTEQRLVKKAQQGDEAAFKTLYDKYTSRVYAFVVSRVPTKDSEDLVALIWEKVITHLESFIYSFENSFAVWLFTIARNTLYTFYRKEASTQIIPLQNIEQTYFMEESYVFDQFEGAKIRNLVNQLPPQQAEAVKLKYFSDLKNKEIAQLLNLSEKTVASNLHRALKKLSSLMQ